MKPTLRRTGVRPTQVFALGYWSYEVLVQRRIPRDLLPGRTPIINFIHLRASYITCVRDSSGPPLRSGTGKGFRTDTKPAVS